MSGFCLLLERVVLNDFLNENEDGGRALFYWVGYKMPYGVINVNSDDDGKLLLWMAFSLSLLSDYLCFQLQLLLGQQKAELIMPAFI